MPVDPRGHNAGGHEQGPDGRKPKRQAAQKQPPARAFETARQFAVAGVPHHVALKVRLRPRISKSETHDDQNPPQDGIQSVKPARSVLMETQAAEHRARQPIAPRPIAGEFAEHDEQRQAAERGGVIRQIELKRCQGNGDVDRNKDRYREQKSEQKLGREPVIFERLAGDLGIGPEKAANVGHQPEPIDAERDEQQSRPFDPKLPISPFRADEADQTGKRRRVPRERGRRGSRKRRRIKGDGVGH